MKASHSISYMMSLNKDMNMEDVLFIHAPTTRVRFTDSRFGFIYRKISADRFNKWWEVLKDRETGRTGSILTKDEIDARHLNGV
jgi:hypothetical protein